MQSVLPEKKGDYRKHGDDDEHSDQGAAQALEFIEDLISIHFSNLIAPCHI